MLAKPIELSGFVVGSRKPIGDFVRVAADGPVGRVNQAGSSHGKAEQQPSGKSPEEMRCWASQGRVPLQDRARGIRFSQQQSPVPRASAMRPIGSSPHGTCSQAPVRLAPSGPDERLLTLTAGASRDGQSLPQANHVPHLRCCNHCGPVATFFQLPGAAWEVSGQFARRMDRIWPQRWLRDSPYVKRNSFRWKIRLIPRSESCSVHSPPGAGSPRRRPPEGEDQIARKSAEEVASRRGLIAVATSTATTTTTTRPETVRCEAELR